MTGAKKWCAFLGAALALTAAQSAFAGAVAIPVDSTLKNSSYEASKTEGDALGKTNDLAIRLVGIFKMFLNGVAVIWMVYNGFMMVISYANEDQLTKAKTQLWYAVVAFLFVNIPGQLVSLFTDKKLSGSVTAKVGTDGFTVIDDSCTNLIFCPARWKDDVGYGIMAFMEIGLIGASILMFSIGALQLIANRGDSEDRKNIKQRFFYGAMALVFVGVIEAWIKVVSTGDLKKAQTGIFSNLVNLCLLFAGPMVIFFLSYAAYLYITSNGDEDKIKQAKSILVNSFVGVLLLLATYAFINDLVGYLN